MNKTFSTKYKFIFFDIMFVITSYICLFLYNTLNGSSNFYSMIYAILIIGGNAVSIIIIQLFPYKNDDTKYIYKNKSAIIPFLIIFTLLLTFIFITSRYLGLNNNTPNKISHIIIILMKLGITSTILICYFFKVKLNCFKWNLKLKDFILVLLVYVTIILFQNLSVVIHSMVNVNNILNIYFIKKFILLAISNSIYPGIYEEVLFRGILISGLKGFGVDDNKTNTIQSILFGISHVMSWGTASWIFLLHTAAQAIMGYVLGKVYFKTKSLTPCILLHGLVDVVVS